VIFNFDVVTAFITCVSCAMIVIEIYGVSCYLMSFNVFVAAISLMGMGLSVEFTAHLAAAFSQAKGPPAERLGEAMVHTFPAIIEGSFSTFFSIMPMAFHHLLFTVKYLFGIIALIIFFGMINGFVVMPALMGLLSPLVTYIERMRERVAVSEKDDDAAQKLPTMLGPSGAAGAVADSDGTKDKATTSPKYI
jgi:hypothetical protein